MNRLVRLTLLLYPRQWRARYGEELVALLEQTNGGWRDALNIVKGAIIMQFSKTTTLAIRAAVGVAIYLATWAMHDTGHEASVTAKVIELDPLFKRAQLMLSSPLLGLRTILRFPSGASQNCPFGKQRESRVTLEAIPVMDPSFLFCILKVNDQRTGVGNSL